MIFNKLGMDMKNVFQRYPFFSPSFLLPHAHFIRVVIPFSPFFLPKYIEFIDSFGLELPSNFDFLTSASPILFFVG